MAVVAEPTTMQIEIATKGRLVAEIVTHGRTTHGSRPWLGHNAIIDMKHVIDALMELDTRLEKRRHSLLGQSSLNIGTLTCGILPTLVPSDCRLHAERRTPPHQPA